jgi:hypothetical protein
MGKRGVSHSGQEGRRGRRAVAGRVDPDVLHEQDRCPSKPLKAILFPWALDHVGRSSWKVQIIRDAILWLAMLFGIAATGLFGTPALFRKMFVNSNVRLF